METPWVKPAFLQPCLVLWSQLYAKLLKTMFSIKSIATTLPPPIKNDTPSYMVPSDPSGTNYGAKNLKPIDDKDHMYGASVV